MFDKSVCSENVGGRPKNASPPSPPPPPEKKTKQNKKHKVWSLKSTGMFLSKNFYGLFKISLLFAPSVLTLLFDNWFAQITKQTTQLRTTCTT